MKFLKRIFLALLVALVTVGCSKEDRRVYLESISIPRTITIEEGQSQKLSVSVLPNGITEEYTILWKCSDNTIASVDKNGNVKAIKAGTTTIIAYEKTKQNIKSECEITVTAKPVKIHSVSFVEAPSSLIEEESTTLIVEVAPENINQPYQLEYASSQTEVATIDNTGNLTAIKAGKTTISVYVKDNSQVKDEFELTVMEKTIPINSVSFKEAPTELVVDGEQDLIVEVAPENVNEPYELIFTSSDQTVATVSETGRLKALKTGKALIGVFVNNNPEINAEFELTVREKPIPIESLSFSTYKETLEEGRTDQISVSVVPDNINVPYKLMYASSEKSVAIVDESGLVTAIKTGTTTISAYVENNEKIKAEYILTVTPKKVEIESITFQDNKTSLVEGETNQTSLKVNPENINQPYKISYKSSNTDVATIDDKGLVTAIKAGQSTISAFVEGRDIKAEYILTVTPKKVEIESITFQDNKTSLVEGETNQTSLKVNPENINQPYKISYKSSNTDVATIDDKGLVTAIKAGQSTISAFVEGRDIKTEYILTVKAKPIEIQAITITNNRSSIDVGEILDLQVSVSPEGVNQPYELLFFSSNPQIASITQQGRIEALNVGNVKISVSVSGKPDIKAEFEMLVDKIINIPDVNFKIFVATKYDTDGDGRIRYSEIKDVKELSFVSTINSTEGIEYFEHLEKVYFWQGLTSSPDFSYNKNLRHLSISGKSNSGNESITLDLTANELLDTLVVQHHGLLGINLGSNSHLKVVTIISTPLTDIDLNSCSNLRKLSLYSNKLLSLNIRDLKLLEEVNCEGNLFKRISITGCEKLATFKGGYNPNLISVDLSGSGFISFKRLYSDLFNGGTANLEELILNECLSLENVTSNHMFKKLSLQGCIMLKSLSFEDIYSNSDVASVNVNDCVRLQNFNARSYYGSAGKWSSPNITELSLNNCVALSSLIINSSKIKELDLSTCKNLKSLSTSTYLEKIYVWAGWTRPTGWEYNDNVQIIEK